MIYLEECQARALAANPPKESIDIMHPLAKEWVQMETRRQFLRRGANALGMAALASLGGDAFAAAGGAAKTGLPHWGGKAKHVIYLHCVGGPAQMDLYDYKPQMQAYYDKDLPESVRNGQRLTTMTSGQARFPIAPSKYKFEQYGKSGAWVSELLPWTAKIVDDVAIIKTVTTEAINHDPAVTYICTGHQLPGRASLGAWLSYGLGTMNKSLPTFVVMAATWTGGNEA